MFIEFNVCYVPLGFLACIYDLSSCYNHYNRMYAWLFCESQTNSHVARKSIGVSTRVSFCRSN